MKRILVAMIVSQRSETEVDWQLSDVVLTQSVHRICTLYRLSIVKNQKQHIVERESKEELEEVELAGAVTNGTAAGTDANLEAKNE